MSEYKLSFYQEGAEAFFDNKKADTNPYGLTNEDSKFYEWALGWYRTAYIVENKTREISDRPWWRDADIVAEVENRLIDKHIIEPGAAEALD